MRRYLGTFLVLFSVLSSFPAGAYDPESDSNQDFTVDGKDILLLEQERRSSGTVDESDLFNLQHHWKTSAPEITIDLPGLPADATPLVLVRMLAGTFEMGSYDDPGWSQPNEQPVHSVTMEYDFYMGKYEVTQAQWWAVYGCDPSSFLTCGINCPVEMVSWEDCQVFLASLNSLVGNGTFRLPSEAEWEYACRAGTTTRFYFGESDCQPEVLVHCELDSYAWWHQNSQSTPHPVGLKLPNPFGLYDMIGNVWEWCQDDYHASYDGAPSDGSSWGDGTNPSRIVRGGNWSVLPPLYFRSASRSAVHWEWHRNDVGLRVVWTP